MNDKDKKVYDAKIQAALNDIQELIEKHGCLFTLDPISLCMVISFHTDKGAQEQLGKVVANRWRASVCTNKSMTPEYEVCSPEMQEAEEMKQKMEKLGMILDPMEMVEIMTRIASGEKPSEVLTEYDGKIEEMDARLKSIEDDPTKLLADFGSQPKDEEGFDLFDKD